MKCTLVLSLAEDVTNLEGDLIGVDRGAFILAKNNLFMKLAIGDFDSVNLDELELVKHFTEEVIQLNPDKDETDTLSALLKVIDLGYDEIILYGGLSKRLDHTLANILLLINNDKIKYLQDENTLVSVFEKGEYIINNNYKYVSFFAISETLLSLNGFKYDLDKYLLKKADIIGISNEIISNCAKLFILNGKLLAVQVNEK
jgi:thiamine pyrophosphokinase